MQKYEGDADVLLVESGLGLRMSDQSQALTPDTSLAAVVSDSESVLAVCRTCEREAERRWRSDCCTCTFLRKVAAGCVTGGSRRAAPQLLQHGCEKTAHLQSGWIFAPCFTAETVLGALVPPSTLGWDVLIPADVSVHPDGSRVLVYAGLG